MRDKPKRVVKGPRLALAMCLALTCLSAPILSSCGRGGDYMVIAGSTSVQPYAEILAESYALSHGGAEVDVQGGGSSAGISAVEAGIADIAMSSRALSEKEGALFAEEIARDGLAVIVHPSNPIDGLTMAQLRRIYSQGTVGWDEFGGNKHKVHVIAREEGSGTRSVFTDIAMGGEAITPKAIVQNSNGAIKQLVSGDPNAIGFISLGLVDESVKALSLDGVEATVGNILSGEYGLFRSFLFVTQGEPEGQARSFMDYTLSEEGQRILSREGLIPR